MNRVYRKPGKHRSGFWVLELDGREYTVRDVVSIVGVSHSGAVLRFQHAARGAIALEEVVATVEERLPSRYRPPKRREAVRSRAEDLPDIWRQALCSPSGIR